VTNQGADTVTVADVSAARPVVTDTITVGTHPNVLDRAGRLLYVADGDSDEVSVVDTPPHAGSPAPSTLPPTSTPRVGSNPTAVALSPDEETLYVANAGNNDVAVVDVETGRVRGLIPTAGTRRPSWRPATGCS
jgi:YVTN family beta-propeller protein